MPRDYFGEAVAATYDQSSKAVFDLEVLGPTVDVLAELAGDGPALEFAIGTGRVALPLAARGVSVSGIELSTAMAERLRTKPGVDRIEVTIGDMATTRGDGSGSCTWCTTPSVTSPPRTSRPPASPTQPGRSGTSAIRQLWEGTMTTALTRSIQRRHGYKPLPYTCPECAHTAAPYTNAMAFSPTDVPTSLPRGRR